MPPGDELSVRDGYAAWAPIYDDDGNPLIAIEGPAVRRRLGDLSGRRAIDLGCGTGRHSRAILEAGAAWVAATDVTPEMMARARDRLRDRPIGWIRHELPGPLPFPDETFDLAVLGLVIEHVEDHARLFREVARVVAPGGRCLVSALHPDLIAGGQRARYIEPETGRRRSITTYHRSIADYLAAGAAAGMIVEPDEVLMVSPELTTRLPRALPYLGRPLGWLGSWRKPAS